MPRYMPMPEIYALVRRTAENGAVLVVDCLSRIDPMGLRSLGSIRPYLDGIHIVRAFTAYQLKTIVAELDGWASEHGPAVLLIVGMDHLLEELPPEESAFIRGNVRKNARKVCRDTGSRTIYVELPPIPGQERTAPRGVA